MYKYLIWVIYLSPTTLRACQGGRVTAGAAERAETRVKLRLLASTKNPLLYTIAALLGHDLPLPQLVFHTLHFAPLITLDTSSSPATRA